MKIEVNGKLKEIAPETSIRTLLEQTGINPNVVACELNLTIVRRAQLSETKLQEGDKLEILQMIGGG